MAMQATHLRFALDLEDLMGIDNKTEYYAGVLYPDSRYITGIARSITHNRKELFNIFTDDLSDFEKGWALHLYYDRHQRLILRSLLEIGFSKKFSHNDDYWLNITAAKLVEELESIARDEVIGAFEYLDVWHAPAGENLHLLNAWYEGQRNFYLTKPKKIEDFANLLSLTPGFPYRQVIKKAKILAADTRKAKQIQDIYSVLLKQAKKEYEKLSSKAG